MDRKVKVMWLIKGLGVGGAEQLLANSVPYLDRSRFSYEIAYFLPWKNALVSQFTSRGVPAFCLNARTPLDLMVVRRLARLLRERQVDILDCHLPYPGVIGRLAGRLAGVPVVMYTEHSLAVQRRIEGLRYISFFANVFTYFGADLILCVSGDTYQDVRRFNLWRTPMQHIYNGIDLAPLESGQVDRAAARQAMGIPAGHRVVGHVANMASKKRQVDLLKAARLVVGQDSDVTFLLVGRGPELEKLRRMARDMGLERHVILPGFVDDLRVAMSAFDVFVLSSLYEGLPTVIMEAMAMGIPPVATRVGGTPEIISEGVDGFLVRPMAPEEIARKVLALLRDDSLRQAMSERGRRKVRELFDIRRRVREVEEVYQQLLVRHRSSLATG